MPLPKLHPRPFTVRGVYWVDGTAIVLAHEPSYVKGQSGPAMEENAWSVWDLSVALVERMWRSEMRDAFGVRTERSKVGPTAIR
jgi:hypothetical protein